MLHKIKFICSLILIISHPIYSQYINPPFAGTTSDGQGGVGTVGVGSNYGFLNPAGCFSDHINLNFSTYTGLYSDWILYFPTIKNISLRYPIITNRLCVGLSYGIPVDNFLRYDPSRRIIGSGPNLRTYKRSTYSFKIAYHPPILKYFDKLDLFLGTNISYYWRTTNPDQIINDDFGLGAYARGGAIIEYRCSSHLRIKLSGLLQPNSKALSTKSTYPGYYGGGMGFKYIFNKRLGNYLEIGGELLMPFWYNSKAMKMSGGVTYRFRADKNSSLQLGVFSYPFDPINSYNPIYWSSWGFTYDFKYFTASIAFMDAINLKDEYLERADIAKVISFSLNVPLRYKLFDKTTFGIKQQPLFYYPSYTNKSIKIGQIDTLSFFIENQGIKTLPSTIVYTNVVEKEGLLIKDKVLDIGDLKPKELRQVNVPLESLTEYPSQEFTIRAECAYMTDKSIVKYLKVNTVRPILNLSVEMKPHRQFLVVPVPGVSVMKIILHNSGNLSADSIWVILPEKLKEDQIIEENKYFIKHLTPGQKKEFRVLFSFRDNLKTDKIPMTINVKEKNGYEPLPYYTSINLINRGYADQNSISEDVFNQDVIMKFNDYYIVCNPEYEQLKPLFISTGYNVQSNNHFPGKIAIGPYDSYHRVYDLYNSLKVQIEDACIYGIYNAKVEPLSRYFISVAASEATKDKLADIGLFKIYTSTFETGTYLVGPFEAMTQIGLIYEFFEKNFQDIKVVNHLPNEVALWE